jgi:hypothetical protein
MPSLTEKIFIGKKQGWAKEELTIPFGRPGNMWTIFNNRNKKNIF